MPYLFETDEHASLRAEVRRFAERAIAPNAHAWDEAGEFPRALYADAGDAGVLGVGFPTELGGAGGDLSHVIAAAEELVLAGTSPGVALSLGSHGIGLPPILHLGTDEQKRRFLPPVLRGEKISALAITEPGAGSDVAGITTRAVRDGDHYAVDGAKLYITSGNRADYVTCAVRTGGPGHAGVSLLVVERGTPGFTTGRPLKKMGMWASDTAELVFENCRVPAGNLLGEEGSGFVALMQNFVAERLALACHCVAIGELAYRASCAYVRERRAFGKTLSGFQVVRHKLADMATSLAAARALTGEVTARAVRGESAAPLAAMAKNAATDMVRHVTDEAVQLHGGMGYMRESLVERLYRDARLYAIGGGAREIMNELIARVEGY